MTTSISIITIGTFLFPNNYKIIGSPKHIPRANLTSVYCCSYGFFSTIEKNHNVTYCHIKYKYEDLF